MAGDYTSLIETYAAKFGVPVALAVAQHRAEDAPDNPSIVSPAGAIGLFQLMPATALDLLNDRDLLRQALGIPEFNVLLGMAFDAQLRQQVSEWFQGADLWKGVMAAYNCGAGGLHKAITACQQDGRDQTLFENVLPYLPKETQGYCTKIWAEFSQADNSQA
jgi:soluble lytic murein transglycosylase-like protein